LALFLHAFGAFHSSKEIEMSRIIVFVAALAASMFAVAPAHAGYHVNVDAEITGPNSVKVDIESNIPSTVFLAVSLSLKGLRPDDTFIGTSFEKVKLTNGKASTVIDATKGVSPSGSQLPRGEYYVEVAFYPRWKENKSIAKTHAIHEAIEGKALITLSGSGEGAAHAQARAEGQKWVMLNVHMGQRWDPAMWREKFGAWEQVELRGRGNPNIIKMYYFRSIDVTLMVNTLKKEIVTWRKGLAHN
jgi:hypothetical protein